MTSISINGYIDKLDDIVNKYNIYSAIKMNPVDVKSNTCINSCKEDNNKDPKFEISDQNIKIYLQMVMFQIGLKKFL